MADRHTYNYLLTDPLISTVQFSSQTDKLMAIDVVFCPTISMTIEVIDGHFLSLSVSRCTLPVVLFVEHILAKADILLSAN